MANDKYFLITTALEETWRRETPIVFLGEWCRKFSLKETWEKLDGRVLPYHWNDTNKFHEDYHYISEFYERLLPTVRQKLNQIHDVSYSERYWRILIGPWLSYFIQILFDRWSNIELVSRSYCSLDTVVLIGNDQAYVPIDMPHFGSLIVGDEWNHYIYSQILENFSNISCIKKVHNFSNLEDLGHVKRKSLKKNILDIYIKIFRKLFKIDDVFIIGSYLPLCKEIKLHFKLGQIPQLWTRVMTPNIQSNFRKRSWSIDGFEESEFEKFVVSMLPKQIPTIYLEGYQKLKKIVKQQPWPISPKMIFTSNELWFGVVTQAYVAEKTEEGTPLVYGQHGGVYGVSKLTWAEDHEVKISDKYISWGWDDEQQPKIKALGILKDINFSNIFREEKINLLFVDNSLPRYSTRLHSEPISTKLLGNINDGFVFANRLDPIIKKKLIVRLYPHEYGWEHFLRWRTFNSEICIDDGKSTLKKRIKKSRICVFSYNSTGYLEALAANIPTIMYWNPESCPLRKSAEPYFEKLLESGVLHESPESAASHINAIWDDIESWWYSEGVRDAVNNFTNRYCKVPNDIVRDLALELGGGGYNEVFNTNSGER